MLQVVMYNIYITMLDLKFNEISENVILSKFFIFIDKEMCRKYPAQHHIESQRFHLKLTIPFCNAKYVLTLLGPSEKCMLWTCEGDDKPWRKIRKQTPKQVTTSI